MPIWLRRFTFNNINEHYEKDHEEYNKALGKGETLTNKTQVFKPPKVLQEGAKPTYTSKVSRKQA